MILDGRGCGDQEGIKIMLREVRLHSYKAGKPWVSPHPNLFICNMKEGLDLKVTCT